MSAIEKIVQEIKTVDELLKIMEQVKILDIIDDILFIILIAEFAYIGFKLHKIDKASKEENNGKKE